MFYNVVSKNHPAYRGGQMKLLPLDKYNKNNFHFQ